MRVVTHPVLYPRVEKVVEDWRSATLQWFDAVGTETPPCPRCSELEAALRMADAMLESLRGELDALKSSPAVRAIENLAAPGFGSLGALTSGKQK